MRYYVLIILLTIRLFAQNNEVTLQLQWKHQFQFAGFYIAKEKGFYRDVGLNVNIKEFEHSIDVVDEVVSERATYGIGRSSLLIDESKGKPIKIISAIFQSSPSILVTTNPNIKLPSDLFGKKVMITGDELQSASITTMLLLNGISKDKIIIQPHSFDCSDLINGKTDAMACYISNEPYYFKKNNIPYKIFNPKEYGYDFYGDIIFTSQKEIDNHPKRVKSFHDASQKGWLWAFENIEDTAKLIYEKYNTQNKSLESLIYEGKVLKDLALVDNIPFGHISKKKFQEIAKIYKIAGLLDNSYKLSTFLDSSKISKQQVKIGVLAKRGKELTHKRWDVLAEYLNTQLDTYDFSIVPLNFTELKKSVKNNSIDFVITNTMYYVQLESKYGVSRIATLKSTDYSNKVMLKEFGGVIFTRSDNKKIKTIKDLSGSSFGAVSHLSFGGWIMAYEELLNHGVDKHDIKLRFLNTHDRVVNAVLSAKIDAGTVRTDTLERMASEGLINLSDIKVLSSKKYDNFPHLVSTKLYPEWPIAKLKYTSDSLADELLSELVSIKNRLHIAKEKKIDNWTVPLDYSSVHNMLKRLKIDPYDNNKIKLIDILTYYSLYFYIISLLIILLIAKLIYDRRINKHLSIYSIKLDAEVKERTKELNKANEKLKILASTDFLTGISNRGYFMKLAKRYFNIAKRNNTNLQVLSLDLDYFKQINDTYGHQAGDDILQEFVKTVTVLLRDSDLFGRIGGEEFCIILQNTSQDGADIFAHRICKSIENMRVQHGEALLHITVSIGMATISDEDKIDDLIKKSDIALYRAKENGRNQVWHEQAI